MSKRCTTEEFILKSKEKYGNKYLYYKTLYGKNNRDEIIITCPKHGDFKQTPHQHLRKNALGCPQCSDELDGSAIRYTKEDFIKKGRTIHNWFYDYSKVEYNKSTDKVCIICPKHGEFWQEAHSHLCGHGCPKCRSEKLSKKFSFTTEEYIKQVKKIHEDKYDYSRVKYINCNTKIDIICPIHGNFKQLAMVHKSGFGCPKCSESKLEKDLRIFLELKTLII